MIKTKLIKPSPGNWEHVGVDIFSVEKTVFSQDAFDEQMLRIDINDPRTILVVLKDKEQIIGFVYSMPESDGLARIVDVAILPAFQHKGYISSLMCMLENEMIKQCYEYFTEDAMVENGYAEKILKHYESRIVETHEFEGDYGKQRYFKIRL
jgi:ribosomal protein S18 acetylase RimI-like enzyme